MKHHLKALREFLCDHNAGDATHFALDAITHHLRMLPEERDKRAFVVGDWVRIPVPDGDGPVAKVIAFTEGGLRLSGLVSTFQPYQLEHWFPFQGEDLWNKKDLKRATAEEALARGADYIWVRDGHNDGAHWDLVDCEPYVGQNREQSVPRTPRVPPCPVGEESGIPACGDPNCKGSHA
jgi:hypothetical protein